VFDLLSHMQFQSGELAAALETTGRWITLDPLQETAYRRVMQIL
jgi:DNA-binding SARP family transcriptional activator